MTQNRVISTAVLFLLLGTAIPALAQKGEEEKAGGGGKAQPAQHQAQPQHAQKAQPQQRAQQAQPQRAQQAQPQQRAQQAQPQRAQQAQPQQRAQQAQPQRAQQAQPQRAQQAQPQRAQQAQPQRAQKAQPQRAEQAQPQRAQQAKPSGRQQPQAVANNRGGGHYGRISDTSYRAHFGRGHSFHMMRPQMIGGYNRFQYGGYWFGFNEGWPVGWDYNDDFYVEYVDGVYYMYNLRHPGIQITLSMF